MLNKNISLNGKLVTMRGINESDFEKIIVWRNDPEINRYLNQPYKLTYEMQTKWYNEKYITTDDILFVFIENSSGRQLGTIGVSNIHYDFRRAIAGRLVIGEKEYRASPELLEGNLLFYDFLFYILGLQKVYCHIVKENRKAIALDVRLGFHPNTGKVVYPQYCYVNNEELLEMINTRQSYEESKEKLRPMLSHFICQKLKSGKG